MKIGILGTRGIPNAYGGFEQFAQFLSEGLVQRGHHISVYSSSDHPYKGNEWRGVKIIHCPDLENKIGTAGQFLYDVNCLLDSRKRHFDVLLQLGYTSNSVWHTFWPKDSVNLINMDGLEWKRSKYSALTRAFLRYAERLAVRHADHLIADSKGIQDYLQHEYHASSTYIPYGADIFQKPNHSCLSQWNLDAKTYLLIIARIEPENNIDMMIRGWLDSYPSRTLVVVGNASNRFGVQLRKRYSQDNLQFIGSIYDQEQLNNLRYYCHSYLHGHSVGGTNPSLLEAMACSCSIIAHRNPFNQGILGDCADYFETAGELSNILNESPRQLSERENRIMQNLEKIRTSYNWEKILSDYESLFQKSVTGSSSRSQTAFTGP